MKAVLRSHSEELAVLESLGHREVDPTSLINGISLILDSEGKTSGLGDAANRELLFYAYMNRDNAELIPTLVDKIEGLLTDTELLRVFSSPSNSGPWNALATSIISQAASWLARELILHTGSSRGTLNLRVEKAATGTIGILQVFSRAVTAFSHPIGMQNENKKFLGEILGYISVLTHILVLALLKDAEIPKVLQSLVLYRTIAGGLRKVNELSEQMDKVEIALQGVDKMLQRVGLVK